MEEVKMLSFWASPFALRVIWALKLKRIEFETIEEDLPKKSNLLLQFNPIYKKVPVFLHNGKPICESLSIIEYIDETWKQYPLLPQDPLDRAKARFWAKFGDDKVLKSAFYDTFVKQGKEQEEGIASTMENLKYLEDELVGKTYFGGEKIGLVDLSLGWVACFISVWEEIIGLKIIDQEKFPLVAQWIQEFSNDPIIQQNWPSRDRLVARFSAIRQSYLNK
ncbi:probable glutathione S-transferase [Mercurialis annua]|uniref:probable glutathione S-transferase n=1 Tax=Mercurialis annua TaxID=3986 RepID=UPI00215FBDB5|nr:probable glutathione S-transferase [Mercurialis annua]